MLVVIFISALIIVFVKPSKSNSDMHKELFIDQIEHGLIINKFIDYDNHALKTVEIKTNAKTYKVLFIPYDNWTDFEKINIGDSISKPPKSFHFRINNEYEFQLKLERDYMKD